MSIATSLKSIAESLTNAATGVQNEVATMRERIQSTRAALKRAESQPIPLDEIDERIAHVVQARGQRWLKLHDVVRGTRGLGAPRLKGEPQLPEMNFDAICVGCPDLAEQMLRGIVRAVPCEPGSRSADRPAILERLANELAALEEAEEAAIDQAAEAGVVIAHRSEVVQRRQNEVIEREREEARVADRAARQNALDQAYAQRTRTGRSQYLQNQQKPHAIPDDVSVP